MKERGQVYLIAYLTLVRKEITRFLRIWPQTILPPAVTMTLYFIIFGQLMGPRIGAMDGLPYMSYIAPGIIMMSVITNSYANVVSSFFSAKFQKHIEELLVSPMPNSLILAGYVTGGIGRGLMVGLVVTCVALLFTDLRVHEPAVVVLVVTLTATLFSLGGFINAIYARKFDDISIVPTFVLTPLTYLGGVFYSIDLLPQFWQRVSLGNPILYMVNAFRYGMLGVTDIPIDRALLIITGFILALTLLSLHLLRRGTGLRS
ncbi:MAG: ABC transporter permease [Gammaproteobacteria bacterium]|nr:MAG: ABC transporter permease [Gammaproteobacteria bacterium]